MALSAHRKLSRLSILYIIVLFLLPVAAMAEYVPDELIVRLKPGRGLSQLSRLQGNIGAKVKQNIERERFYTLKLPEGLDLGKVIARFRSHPAVEYAGPNHIFRIALEPDDPLFRNDYSDDPPQWGLYNDGYNNDFFSMLGGTSVEGADIHAEEAWDVTTGSSSVIIASVDTGVDYTHEDLAGNIWTNPGEIAGNGIDDDKNGYVDDIMGWNFVGKSADVQDDHGHGTFTASVADAEGNNGVGMAGVAWNCRIMALKVLDENGYGLEDDAAKAVMYAVDNGAKVINMSMEGDDAPLLKYAVNYAWNKGAICVCASGNEDQGPDKPSYPASYTNALSVGASNQSDERCSEWDWFTGGSNYGYYLDVVAPGAWITGASPYDQYTIENGTSAAAPFVSGIAALVWSVHPDWSNAEVFFHILHTADDVDAKGYDIYTGWGRVNAWRAVSEPINYTGSVGNAKITASNTPVVMKDMVLSCSSTAFTDRIYVQNEDRSSGIMVYYGDGNVPPDLEIGDRLTVLGTTGTVSGECAILNPVVHMSSKGNPPRPLGMSNRAVGGGAFGLQGTVVDHYPIKRTYSNAMNNIGLLVTVFGRVTKAQDDWFYIDDGSKLLDNSGYTGIRVVYDPDILAPPLEGDYAAVTGISTCELVQGSTTVRRRIIRPRIDGDIWVISQ
ncbi:MAG: S8 family serine peptidase [Armatimonadota bacterium]